MSARLVRGGKTMYAIVECGGKQYKVEIGDVVELKVLMFVDDNGNVKAGTDAQSVKVSAKVNAQDKFPKVLVFHYKSKKNIRKRQGHRQPYTELKIVSIEG